MWSGPLALGVVVVVALICSVVVSACGVEAVLNLRCGDGMMICL